MIRSHVKVFKAFLLATAAALGSASAASAFDMNKDLIYVPLLGVPASGISVTLEGSQTVTDHYDGYPDHHFAHETTSTTSGGDTQLKWDTPNAPVPPGAIVHVGWSTESHTTAIKSMNFTDASGNIVGIAVELAPGWFYDGTLMGVSLSNDFVPDIGDPQPMFISNIRYAVLPNPVALADLNVFNQDLAAQFQPLDQQFVLNPGDQIVFTLPDPPPPDAYIVLSYMVQAPGSDAQSIDFVQWGVSDP